MAKTQLKEFSDFSNKDFLSFGESSMRELLVRTLSKSGVYTDQIFPGSDLAVLIDITAYMFAMLTYVANNNASEAIFTDAQFYENISRLSKMLSYNPRGFVTASTECQITLNESRFVEMFGATRQPAIHGIPRYTSCRVHGTEVRYSVASGESGSAYSDYQQFVFTIDIINNKPVISVSDNPIFLNGSWKLYPVQLIATGEQRESFTLDQVGSDVIAHPFVDVYVYDPKTKEYERYRPVGSLYDYTMTDKVYAMRVNERKQYELTFGDGVNGVKLEEGQVLYVIYLASDGDLAVIDAGEMDGNDNLELSIVGMTAEEIKTICFGGVAAFDSTYQLFKTIGAGIVSDVVGITNITPSEAPIDFEDVESIRLNAPNAFRSGRRLVNAEDYRQYILNNYPNQIRDCVVMNNFSYCAEFQKYILDHWPEDQGNPQVRIRQYNYRYADSCDHNNVYLWLRSISKGNTSEFIKRAILNDTLTAKCIGAEPIPCDALAVIFAPYVSGNYSVFNWDPFGSNKIVVIKDQSSLSNNDRVKEMVVLKIVDFFSAERQKVGGVVSLQQLYSELLAIDGVKDVYTAFMEGGVEKVTSPGLSFTYWTPVILGGNDRNVIVNSPVKMHNFQYAQLRNSTQLSQVVMVSAYNSFLTSPEF